MLTKANKAGTRLAVPRRTWAYPVGTNPDDPPPGFRTASRRVVFAALAEDCPALTADEEKALRAKQGEPLYVKAHLDGQLVYLPRESVNPA
jgi:hypothetical protein